VTRSPSRNRSDAWRQRLRHAGWHDHLLAAGSCQSLRTTHETPTIRKDIEYRVEARIDEHSEDVQLKQSTLDETYNRRSGVERTNDAVKDCGLGHVRARGRVHARAQVFSRCAFVSLLRSPTTNAETIQEAPSSRYENYSMTPSGGAPIPVLIPWCIMEPVRPFGREEKRVSRERTDGTTQSLSSLDRKSRVRQRNLRSYSHVECRSIPSERQA